ncbi:alpha/beta fold hydrolase [Burkholderia gladioli]|uniref:alpha/beta fold hydrolase n=1 Tax=Burkholderia gladioli TaxID=28095 RepID=UPI00163E4CD8|nr:alpha/beta fold hydrolase [Burkholderia gladioli]MBU9323221.1 alpha/beta fold hydrolase [Burkholderia gladioli]
MSTVPEHAHDERAPNERPVDVVAPQHLTVTAPAGTGVVPLFATGEWNASQPGVDTAVILLHGRLRNADAYFKFAQRARAAAGRNSNDTVLLVPQFLAQADVEAHRLPAETLCWDWTGWMGGGEALAPAPVSSFDVLDALLAALADADAFPSLRTVVVAGHSGGGQVAQRYAVLARGEAALTRRGIALRYVIANPSSYVYFDTRRPDADGGFSPFDAAACAGFNDWKYGLDALPAYASEQPAAREPGAFEHAYLKRDVITLLGDRDCDPRHPALDRSCAAMAQGAHRLERGLAYARYIASRGPVSCTHETHTIPGAGHDADAVFGSPAGIAALFGKSA